ncbi:hypothetical protein GCM10028805_54190 [Spirosoma harenae]
MEAKIIITTELQLKAIVADAVSVALKYYQPSDQSTSVNTFSKKVDFQTARKEYYPGIPESTVRQETAHLSRTKVGKRILLDRDEIEQDQLNKRSKSAKGFLQEADEQFTSRHQRREGRKAA